MGCIDLTKEEKKAIAAIKRVAKIWPDSLWLFSASGNLTVMRKGENGEKVHLDNCGFDQKHIVDYIDIDNDGGDW